MAGLKKLPHYYNEVEISSTEKMKPQDGSNTAASTNSPGTLYESLYTEPTLIVQDYLSPVTLFSKGGRNYYNARIRNNSVSRVGGATAEATYDVPQAMDNIEANKNCYSSLGPIDYSILQPHIPKPTQTQLPPTLDEYSTLQHL